VLAHVSSPRSGKRSVLAAAHQQVTTKRYKRVVPRDFHAAMGGLPLEARALGESYLRTNFVRSACARPRAFWPPAGTSSCSSGEHAAQQDTIRSYPCHGEGVVSTFAETAVCGSWSLADQASSQACTRSSNAFTRSPWAIRRVRPARDPQEIRRYANPRCALRQSNESS
jgi:hypothetical protein